MVFAQLADAFSFCTSPDVRHVRTTADPPMAPEESLKMLKEGNRRFVDGRPLGARTKDAARRQLVDQGQAPHTAIIGCADSRAPLETIFDAMPGDLFVLRNAGNTCTHAEAGWDSCRALLKCPFDSCKESEPVRAAWWAAWSLLRASWAAA